MALIASSVSIRCLSVFARDAAKPYDAIVQPGDYEVQGGVLHVAEGPWATWIPRGNPRGEVRLRLSRDRHGRKTITELRISDMAGVAAGLLRHIPLGALEDVLNSPEPVPRSERRSRAGEIRRDVTIVPEPAVARASIPTPTVEVDLVQVAADYAAAAAITRHPVRKLAEDRGVSERTVSRWLAEVRRRGLLPSARRSRGARR